MTRSKTTATRTFSYDKRVLDIIDKLPPGERSKRINYILMKNLTYLGADLQLRDDLEREYIHQRITPVVLQEFASAIDTCKDLSIRDLQDILGHDQGTCVKCGRRGHLQSTPRGDLCQACLESG